MAETSTVAFGRYLKMLRDRRGLSLQEVASLSDSFPDPISKGYLSRCENGHQKIALNKVIPLSRIYEVPADVIVERLELDMEVDRVGAPDTEGKTYQELWTEARASMNAGAALDAYALARDAVVVASTGSVLPRYRDMREQVATSLANCATPARVCGGCRFALHEFLHVLSLRDAGPSISTFVLERVALAHLDNDHLDAALRFADAAIAEGLAQNRPKNLIHAYCTRAIVAYRFQDYESAVEFTKQSYEHAKAHGSARDQIVALNFLGQTYLTQKRFRAARRVSAVALDLAIASNQKSGHAVALLVIGRVDQFENRPVQARERLEEARELCKSIGNRDVKFGIELSLLRLAIDREDSGTVRSISRRMAKLSPHISRSLDDLADYRQLLRSEVHKHMLR